MINQNVGLLTILPATQLTLHTAQNIAGNFPTGQPGWVSIAQNVAITSLAVGVAQDVASNCPNSRHGS